MTDIKDNALVRFVLKEAIGKNESAEPTYDDFLSFRKKASLELKAYAELIGVERFVLGLSGGLDSTYVALVAADTLKAMNKSASNLILATLPSFATGKRTFGNASALIKDLGATHININIEELTSVALKSLGIAETDRTVAFENIQARLRTALLLTLANKEKALELGTGDFSEIVLGWCTFGGDNISMYNVNATLPKTFIRESILSFGKNEGKDFLVDIADAPISPELLPSKEGEELSQHTEDAIGSYDLVDLFIYLNIVKGLAMDECVKIAKKVLPKLDNCAIIKDGGYIEHYAKVFENRKNSMGFKRLSCPYANLTPLGV